MIFVIAMVISGKKDGFIIDFPATFLVISVRFTCSLLMHLNLKGVVLQGLKMMKFANNHPTEFSNPVLAYFVGGMQFGAGISAELFCIVYLTSLNSPVDVIIKYMALSSIGLIDDIVYKSNSPESRILVAGPALCISVRKRHFIDGES